MRFQALKADDQEAYMRMVKESKNERLTLLLEETNKLLVNLGAAVQRQKDSKRSDGIEPLEDSEADLPESDASKNGVSKESPLDEDMDVTDSDHNGDTNDLLEGQRQYNSAIHSIQEKVKVSWITYYISRTKCTDVFLHKLFSVKVFLIRHFPITAGLG